MFTFGHVRRAARHAHGPRQRRHSPTLVRLYPLYDSHRCQITVPTVYVLYLRPPRPGRPGSRAHPRAAPGPAARVPTYSSTGPNTHAKVTIIAGNRGSHVRCATFPRCRVSLVAALADKGARGGRVAVAVEQDGLHERVLTRAPLWAVRHTTGATLQ